MPMMQIYRCPVCGAESEPLQGRAPEGWLTISGPHGSEVFDRWECARRYSAVKEQEEETPMTFPHDDNGTDTTTTVNAPPAPVQKPEV